jgi:hypothetical protein
MFVFKLVLHPLLDHVIFVKGFTDIGIEHNIVFAKGAIVAIL